MLTRNDPRLLCLLIFSAALLLAAGCGESGTAPGTGGVLAGTVTEAVSGRPLEGIRIALFDAHTWSPAPIDARTGERGIYYIRDVEPGEYFVACVRPDSLIWTLFSRSEDRVAITDGGYAVHDIAVVEHGSWSDSGYRIEGTVRDRRTGVPLPGAIVYGGLSGMAGVRAIDSGLIPLDWCVADPTGRYSVAAVLADFRGDEGFLPVTATCPGYRPRSVGGDGRSSFNDLGLLPPPPAGAKTVALDILLEPENPGSEPPTGAIRGRLVWSTRPLAGVEVRASLVIAADQDTVRTWSAGASVSESRRPAPAGAAVTDEDGRFLLEGISGGSYMLSAGGHGVDRWLGGSDADLRVIAGDTVNCGTIECVAALRPLSPLPGETVPPDPITFRWSELPPMPDSEWLLYRLVVSWSLPDGSSGAVRPPLMREPAWTAPIGTLPAGALVFWRVQAELRPDSAPSRVVGVFRDRSAFRTER